MYHWNLHVYRIIWGKRIYIWTVQGNKNTRRVHVYTKFRPTRAEFRETQMTTWTGVATISYTSTEKISMQSNRHVHDTGYEIHKVHTCTPGIYRCKNISRGLDAYKQSTGKQNGRRGHVYEVFLTRVSKLLRQSKGHKHDKDDKIENVNTCIIRGYTFTKNFEGGWGTYGECRESKLTIWTPGACISHTCTEKIFRQSKGHKQDTDDKVDNVETCIVEMYKCTKKFRRRHMDIKRELVKKLDDVDTCSHYF